MYCFYRRIFGTDPVISTVAIIIHERETYESQKSALALADGSNTKLARSQRVGVEERPVPAYTGASPALFTSSRTRLEVSLSRTAPLFFKFPIKIFAPSTQYLRP